MHPQSTVGFINNFHSGDISNVTIDGFSGHFWAITPPTLKSLIAKVKNRDSELLINFRIECRRPPKEYQSGSLVVDSVYTRKITTDEREELLQELSSTIPYSSQNTATDLRRSANVPASSSPFSKLPHSGIWLRRVVPRFYLAKKDTIRPAPSSLSPHKSAIDIRVLLRCGNSSRSWWELQTQTIGIDTCFNNSKSAPYFATYSAALDSTLALSSTSKPSFSRTNQPIDSISTPIPTSGSSQHDTSILPFEITHTVSNLSNISRKLFTRSLEDEIGPNLAFGSKESGTTNQDTTSLINNDCAGSNVYLPSFMQTLQIIIFSERVSDHLLGKLVTVYGVIGIYAGYIFVIHRLFRNIYSDLSYVVKYAEMPHVDRILNLCHEIYLVRENRLLHLEEQLICKLIFLYRSSETLIKWTRHPKRIIDHFTGNLDVQPFSPYPPLPPPPPYPSPTLLSVSGSVSGSNMQTGSNASGFSIARHRAAGPLSSASEGHLEGFDYPPNQRQYLYSGLQSPIHIPISRQHVQSHYYRNQHSMPYPSRQLEESDLLLGTYGGVLEQSRWPTADNHNICADPTDSLNQAGASQASRAPVFSKSQSKQLGHAMEAKTSTETQEKDCRVILTTDQPLRVAQHPSSGSHVQQVQKQKHQQQQLHQQLRRRVRPVIEESQ